MLWADVTRKWNIVKCFCRIAVGNVYCTAYRLVVSQPLFSTEAVHIQQRGNDKAAIVRVAEVFEKRMKSWLRLARVRVGSHTLPAPYLHKVEAFTVSLEIVFCNCNSSPRKARVETEVVYVVCETYLLQKTFCCQIVEVKKRYVLVSGTESWKANQASSLVRTEMPD